jgi:probable RNA-binding protein EIF1AD
MSGCGRKGAYRKGVTNDVLNGNPVPEEGEVIAQVKGSRGGNVIDIHCGDDSDGIAVMPQKFRKLIWVKRGDFVIVSGATDEIENNNGSSGAIRYRVKHILYKDQIRHIKSEGLWPAIFTDEVTQGAAEDNEETHGGTIEPDNNNSGGAGGGDSSKKNNKIQIMNNYSDDEGEEEEEEGGEEEEEEDNSDLFVNPNHRKVVAHSSDEEEDD